MTQRVGGQAYRRTGGQADRRTSGQSYRRRARRGAPDPDVGAGRNGNGLPRRPARGEGGGSVSGRRWTAGALGAFDAPGPVDVPDEGGDAGGGHTAHDRLEAVVG